MKVFKIENGKLYQGEIKDERENKGECYYCHQPVYVSSGQLYRTITVYDEEYPTHKNCRKLNKK